jgi:hypothetical protein
MNPARVHSSIVQSYFRFDNKITPLDPSTNPGIIEDGGKIIGIQFNPDASICKIG